MRYNKKQAVDLFERMEQVYKKQENENRLKKEQAFEELNINEYERYSAAESEAMSVATAYRNCIDTLTKDF